MVLWHDTLLWRNNGRDGVSNHQPHDCLLNRSFGRRSKKTSKLRVPGLCAGNSPVTGEFPTKRASNAENVFIWWRHHDFVWFQVENDLPLPAWVTDEIYEKTQYLSVLKSHLWFILPEELKLKGGEYNGIEYVILVAFQRLLCRCPLLKPRYGNTFGIRRT